MTRAVIFDFGNVLCFPPAHDKIARAAQFCSMTEHAFLEAFWAERLHYDAGKLSPSEYWTTVTNEAFANENLAKLIEIEIDFWNEYDPRPFDWIAALRRKGLRVGMLSNLPQVLGDALRDTRYLGRPFFDHFDHVTLSCELGSVKPQSPIYRHSFEGLKVNPEEALFIDDKLPNVHGAIETGLRAELFTTWEDFLGRGVPKLYNLPDAPR